MASFLNELIERVKEEIPPFFKIIRNAGMFLSGLSGSIILADSQFPKVLPESIVTLAGYLAVAGIVASGVATTAKKDKEEVQKEE